MKNMKTVSFSSLLVILLVCEHSVAFDNEELEIFDLVDLIDKNFYTAMGISQVRIRGKNIYNSE